MARVNIALLAVLALLCFAASAEASRIGRLARKLMAYACTDNACAGANSGPGLVSTFSQGQTAGLVSEKYMCNLSSYDPRCPGIGLNTAVSAGGK